MNFLKIIPSTFWTHGRSLFNNGWIDALKITTLYMCRGMHDGGVAWSARMVMTAMHDGEPIWTYNMAMQWILLAWPCTHTLPAQKTWKSEQSITTASSISFWFWAFTKLSPWFCSPAQFFHSGHPTHWLSKKDHPLNPKPHIRTKDLTTIFCWYQP